MNTESIVLENQVKITVIGDGTVGKTCLLVSFSEDRFPIEYTPTVFDNMVHTIDFEGTNYHLILRDTAGQECYATLRQNNYLDTDIVLLCYAVDNHNSVHHIREVWKPEYDQFANKDCRLVLCATKIDRRDSCSDCITTEQGKELATLIGAHAYVECSAKSQQGLRSAFEICVSCWKDKLAGIKNNTATNASLFSFKRAKAYLNSSHYNSGDLHTNITYEKEEEQGSQRTPSCNVM